VPYDFWDDARAALQAAEPELFMLAEAEAPAMHRAFDMTYGWELHHLLDEIAQGRKGVEEIDAYLERQDRTYAPGAYRMYFTSNHDENSWQGTEYERMGANHVPAFVLAATLRGGMPLVYTGQEVSNRKRLRFFERDTVNWAGPSLAPFYRTMFDLKHRNEALWNGSAGGAQTRLAAGERFYAFARTKGANTVVVVVNFGDAPMKIAYDGLPHPGEYTDWVSRARETLDPTGTISVPAHGYRVLVR
ncbi:MAG: alpha amylase C-terminal domain-containing protein, partial [Gemmatimonadaceae bacterium]